MEKIIEVKLLDDRNIEIVINGVTIHTILATSRQISADQIYTFMDPQIADKFEIKPCIKNENFDKDNDVLEYFYNMIKAIVDGINGLNKEPEIATHESDLVDKEDNIKEDDTL